MPPSSSSSRPRVRGPGRRRRRARALLAVAGVLLTAGCASGGPPVPAGGTELAVTQGAHGVRHDPEPGPRTTWTVDDGELRRLWADPDLWSQTDPDVLTVPAGQIAVVVEGDHRHHGTEVVRVVEVDGTWLVQLTAHDTAACTLPAVVQAEVYLLLVQAAKPPSALEQEVTVLAGCGEE